MGDGKVKVRDERDKRKATERKAELDALLGPRPPPAPDLTEEALRKARAAEMLRVLSRRGRASTMLTGPQGDTSTPNTRKTTLTGG